MVFNDSEKNIIEVSAVIYEFVPLDGSISKEIELECLFILDDFIENIVNQKENDFTVLIFFLNLCLSQENVVFSKRGCSASLQNYSGDPRAKIGVVELESLINKLEE